MSDGERQLASDELRIVVLPFANFSPDPVDEYFADGMTEEIISAVSGISGLTVISRTSAMTFKGAKKSVEEIGRELKVSKVLEGSVRKAGDRIRIATQLIDITQDKHLWTQSYNRKLGDVFAVQRDIARHVAESLRVKILSWELDRIGRKSTECEEAYALYLKGKQTLGLTKQRPTILKAMEYFKLALDLDPGFALAHVGLADCYFCLNARGHMDDSETVKEARREVLAALKLDEGLAEAHLRLAKLYEYDWDWDWSEWEFNKVIELNPNMASAHVWYSDFLLTEGRFDEALGEAKTALELDPLDPNNCIGVAACFYATEDYLRMIEYCQRALEIEPTNLGAQQTLIWAYLGNHDFERASSVLEKWVCRVPETYASLGRAAFFAMAGDREKSLRLLDQVLQAQESGGFVAGWVSEIYSRLGQEDKMFEWLERLLKEHDSAITSLRWDPDYAKFRSHPRMLAVLKQAGLVKEVPPWLEAAKKDPQWGWIRRRMAPTGAQRGTGSSVPRAEPSGPIGFRGAKDQTKVAFNFLVKAFIEDYMRERLYIEQSGWRSLIQVSQASRIPLGVLYGRKGRYGPVLNELLSRGLVESRTFTGQRGRGGSVIKVRITYDRDPTKRYVDRALQL